MKRYEDIQQLADRFLDGRTSLAEERELERFFAENKADIPSMPESLQVMAEMLTGFSLAAPAPAKRRPWLRWQFWTSIAAAACFAAVLSLAIWRHDHPNDVPTAMDNPEKTATPLEPEPPTLLIAIETPAHADSPVETGAEAAQRADGRQLSKPKAVASNTIPMRSDDDVQNEKKESEMALLEAEFQKYKESVIYVKI